MFGDHLTADLTMAAFLVLALTLVAGLSCSEGISLKNAATTIDRHPFVVQVESLIWSIEWSQICGGSILTSLHVMSSANCFSGYDYIPRNRRIRAGATFRNTGGIIFEVQSESNHPSFGGSRYMDGDITVVRLVSRITFSPVIQQGSIVIQGAEIPEGLSTVHIGWPSLLDGEYYYRSDVVLAVNMNTVDNVPCGYHYSSISNVYQVTENMMCSSLPYIDEEGEEEADMCHADFGGPLLFDNIIVGILSWSHSCTNVTFPSVSTKVSAFTNWIVDSAV